MPSAVVWILRIALAACFVGHGALAIEKNPAWLVFYHRFGLSDAFAHATMPWVGALDLAVAALLMLRPSKSLLVWALAWSICTALLRPLCGGDVFDVLVRASNWGAAVTLLAPRRFVLPSLLVSVAALACGVAGGALHVPGARVWPWLEQAGVLALPLALAGVLYRVAKRREPLAGLSSPPSDDVVTR